jgi:hypothetical protein
MVHRRLLDTARMRSLANIGSLGKFRVKFRKLRKIIENYKQKYRNESSCCFRNSWGVDWGINGYAYIRRNAKNHCGVALYAMFAC